ncbi:hypothetical protein C8R46DRAFT_1193006 [Mycena filopes]|nr:hypothetical protein C8R46DRAFT_1193006 [Mycena filopes]
MAEGSIWTDLRSSLGSKIWRFTLGWFLVKTTTHIEHQFLAEWRLGGGASFIWRAPNLLGAGFLGFAQKSPIIHKLRSICISTRCLAHEAGGFGDVHFEAQYEALAAGLEREWDEIPGTEMTFIVFWSRTPAFNTAKNRRSENTGSLATGSTHGLEAPVVSVRSQFGSTDGPPLYVNYTPRRLQRASIRSPPGFKDLTLLSLSERGITHRTPSGTPGFVALGLGVASTGQSGEFLQCCFDNGQGAGCTYWTLLSSATENLLVFNLYWAPEGFGASPVGYCRQFESATVIAAMRVVWQQVQPVDANLIEVEALVESVRSPPNRRAHGNLPASDGDWGIFIPRRRLGPSRRSDFEISFTELYWTK